MLMACYDSSCIHPLCQKGEPESVHTWFLNGPSVSMFPLPVKDPERPWGGRQECNGTCSGHYLKPKETVNFISNKGTVDCDSIPPSVILKDEFNNLQKAGIKITEEHLVRLANKTLVTGEEVRMWIEHPTLVHERRKSRAKTAAETRRKKAGYSITCNYNAFLSYFLF